MRGFAGCHCPADSPLPNPDANSVYCFHELRAGVVAGDDAQHALRFVKFEDASFIRVGESNGVGSNGIQNLLQVERGTDSTAYLGKGFHFLGPPSLSLEEASILDGSGSMAGKCPKRLKMGLCEEARDATIHIQKANNLTTHDDWRGCVGTQPLLLRHVDPARVDSGIGNDQRLPRLDHLPEGWSPGNVKDTRRNKFLRTEALVSLPA